MKKLREVFRLKFELGYSNHQIGCSNPSKGFFYAQFAINLIADNFSGLIA